MPDAMPPAGPALDAEVAGVLGWYFSEDWGYWTRAPLDVRNPPGRTTPYPYSTSIIYAWQVVEHFRSKQIDVMLFQGERRHLPPELRDETDDQWECALWWQENGEHRETTQYADTAPHAIALAALRALALEVPHAGDPGSTPGA